MKLYEVIQTKNAGYIRARPIKPVGIFVHSTGATNPELRRYVEAPDLLGVNQYGNHWNKTTATKSMRGGHYSNASSTGLGCVYADSSRSSAHSYFGVRSAFLET